MKVRPLAQADREHFWSKVQDGKGDACSVWTAGRTQDGYGLFKFNGRTVRAHRLIWALANGPIPPGLCVCHTCDTPACVRLSHLFLDTRTGNNHDRNRKRRQARGEQNGRAKMTMSKIHEIRRRLAAGEPQRSVASDFGLAPSNVCIIGLGRGWKDIA